MNNFKQISESGLSLLKEFEGFRETPYVCAGGKLTIGYGITQGVTKEMRVTEKQAEILLKRDVMRAEWTVGARVKVPLNQNQFDALVCFVYNVGESNFTRSTLLKLLNEMKYDTVPDQLQRWVRAKGKRVDGLVKRREREAELFSRI